MLYFMDGCHDGKDWWSISTAIFPSSSGSLGTTTYFQPSHTSTLFKNNFYKNNNNFDCFKKASVTEKVHGLHRRMNIYYTFPDVEVPISPVSGVTPAFLERSTKQSKKILRKYKLITLLPMEDEAVRSCREIIRRPCTSSVWPQYASQP